MRSIEVLAEGSACGNAIGRSSVAPVEAFASLLIVAALATGCGGSPSEYTAAGEPIAPHPVLPNEGLSLFAGALGGSGNVDGVGANAAFNSPNSVATDSADNVYVADTYNHTIRKITPAGVVTTLAGTAGASGRVDGTSAEARFNNPRGVATGADGTVYVADTFNGLVRKITPAGVVTTFATGNFPSGVATDSAGNLYVNDCGSAWAGDPASLNKNQVRKISPTGIEMTVAFPGPCTEVAPPSYSDRRFRFPSSIGIDSADNLYIAWEDHHVAKSTPSGGSGFSVGFPGERGSADGTGTDARFHYPSGVAAGPDGTAYVADTYNHTIRQITSAGVVTTLAGSGTYGSDDGVGAYARFAAPMAVASDRAGNLYIADQGNNTIRKIAQAGIVTTLAGTAAKAGSADATGAEARFYEPTGATADSAGNLYLADTRNHTVRKVTSAGVVTTWAGLAGKEGSSDGIGAEARFYFPSDVAADSMDNVYVADEWNDVIRKITSGGAVTTLAGMAGAPGSADGAGAQARFYRPTGLALDRADNIYVADHDAHTIRMIKPLGVVTTLAGTPGASGRVDGTGADARFAEPTSVATDTSGNVYVADSANHAIRKITPEGVVSTLAGTLGASGSADGTGAEARFNNPRGVATDPAGDVYVADTGNQTVRKITAAGVVTTVVGQAGRVGFSPGALPGNLAGPRRLAIRGAQLYVTLRNGVAVVTPLP
jgi:sugar lactone lactonase YvrE